MFPRLLHNRRQPLGLGLSHTVVMRAVSLGDTPDAKMLPRCDGSQPEYHSDSSSRLTTKDLRCVLKAAWDARCKWHNIGTELGIHADDLDSVKERNQNDPDKCFKEILMIWLRGNYSECTWTKLAEALQAKTVGFWQLGETITKSSTFHNMYTKNSDGSSVTHVIKVEEFDRANIDVFRCPCRHNCSLESYLIGGCPRLKLNSFPYLYLKNFDEATTEDVVQKLSRETTDMMSRFVTLLSDTCKSLENRSIAINKLVRCVLDIAAQKSHNVPIPLLREHQAKLELAETIDDVFFILRPHMSFFNYEILQHIIQQLGSCEDNTLLNNYIHEFNDFCRRRVFEVPPDIFGNINPIDDKRKMFATLITEYDFDSTLMDVKKAKRKLADLLGLNSSALILHRIDDGSLILVFSVPSFIADELFLFPLDSFHKQCLKEKGYTIFVADNPDAISDKEVGEQPAKQEVVCQEYSDVVNQTLPLEHSAFLSDGDMIFENETFGAAIPTMKGKDCSTGCDAAVDTDLFLEDEDCSTTHKYSVNSPNETAHAEPMILSCHSSDNGSPASSVCSISHLQDFDSEQQVATVKKEPGGLPKEGIDSRNLKCPICLQILHNPHIVSCCSARFCKRCIDEVLSSDHPLCQLCGSVFQVVGADIDLEHKLQTIHVPCTYASSDSDWTEELMELDNHINTNATHPEKFGGCPYQTLKCRYCSLSFQASDMYFHETNQCSKRPFTCEYCNSFKSTYEKVVKDHLPSCNSYPVECYNGCGETVRRCDIESHVESNCSHAVIDCPLKDEGCSKRLLRIEMRAHLLTHVKLPKLRNAITEANKYHEHVVRKESQSLALTNRLQDCGFEFAEAIPESFPLVCPVCRNFLQDPYQAICCGKNFCKGCTKRIKSDTVSCPLCKQKFETFFNKGYKQQLLQLKIHCKHFKSGCHWIGELGYLENHINSDPPEQQQLQGCQFAEIHCLYCKELYQRCQIEKHQSDECLKREFSCEYCRHTSTFEDITSSHHLECRNYPVQCPNRCGEMLIKRCDVESHIANSCKMQPIIFECDFNEIVSDNDYGYRVSGLPYQMIVTCSECKSHLDNLRHIQHKQGQCSITNESSTCISLSVLRKDIDIAPKQDRSSGCCFKNILCSHCSKYFKHRDIRNHEHYDCDYRPQEENIYHDTKG